MPRGGPREGSGRKQRLANKATAARQAEVAASGVTPLEVMLANMRLYHRQAEEFLEADEAVEDAPDRAEQADDADGGEDAGAAQDAPADAFEPRRNPFLDAFVVGKTW